MKLLVTGVSHKTAPVEVREKLAFPENRLTEALGELRACEELEEALILSTCNRVEILVSSSGGADARTAVDRFLAGQARVELESVNPYLYRHTDGAAIHHLFRVAASLDSMVIGEPQILGQLKSAYALAKQQGAVYSQLDGLLSRAFQVAKRVRSETGIGQMAVSVSYAAVELARKIFGSLKGRNVLIVGAGKMSELAARHLQRSGATKVFVTNRTEERARQLAEMFRGTVIDYQRFPQMLPEMDIVIASSGAPHYILGPEDVSRALHLRKNRPVFLIDIAVPRNIDPEVNKIEGVFLYDVDDLEQVVQSNLAERQKEADLAERIVAQEVEKMVERLRVQDVAPAIMSLQDQLEQIRAAEVSRMRKRFGELTPQQEEAIEALTRGIINKIAHGPISELRRHAGRPEGAPVVDAIRRVFHLQDGSS